MSAGHGSAYAVDDPPRTGTATHATGDATGTGAGVVGDGSTVRSRAAGRWRRSRVLLGALVLVVLVALLAVLPEPRTSTTPLAADNPRPGGARAVAQILSREGVHVVATDRFADVVAADGPGVTVAVLGETMLGGAQLDALPTLEADLVLVGAPYAAERVAGIGPVWSATTTDEALAARCDDPDAVAAGTVTHAGALQAPDGATVCFASSHATAGQGAYVVTTAQERRVVALGDAAMLTNAHLAEEGNAALALRMLGRHDEFVWYVPSWDDPYEGPVEDETLGATMPPWTGPLAWQLALVVLVAALWRGRRMGRLVTEPLPVVVRAGEATRGRGRLYRRSRAYGHAAAALRAGTASRLAERLGLPRSAPAPALIEAVTRASAVPTTTVEALLYGPPPTSDDALATLARDLDHLESEVHRT